MQQAWLQVAFTVTQGVSVLLAYGLHTHGMMWEMRRVSTYN